MRKAEGKKYGYIIIPVLIPADVASDKVFSGDNFKVVWSVLNALRAHDDRFNATINQIELNTKKPNQIMVETIGGEAKDNDETGGFDPLKDQIVLQFEEIKGTIYAKIVKKCGEKPYWDEWAGDVAKLAERNIVNIQNAIKTDSRAEFEFNRYLTSLRANINPSVSADDAVEMLAQHITIKPVFGALFNDYSFVKENEISKSLERVLGELQKYIETDAEKKLGSLYTSVKERAKGIDNAEGRQKIIVDLYEKFFKIAFSQITKKLGIVYTPVEIVDFIIQSVEDVLQREFGQSMSDKGVHILDPFTGTGTFMTRLLQSGIIKDKDIQRKYAEELHANEMVLLAYYIAAINIEIVYHDRVKRQRLQGEQVKHENIPTLPENSTRHDAVNAKAAASRNVGGYLPFPNICLTDTFQLSEAKGNQVEMPENFNVFGDNTDRITIQKQTKMKVIFGNPPYSIGQRSANDNAQNQVYAMLNAKIAQTYAAKSKVKNKNSL
jgi:predicted helicase